MERLDIVLLNILKYYKIAYEQKKEPEQSRLNLNEKIKMYFYYTELNSKSQENMVKNGNNYLRPWRDLRLSFVSASV